MKQNIYMGNWIMDSIFVFCKHSTWSKKNNCGKFWVLGTTAVVAAAVVLAGILTGIGVCPGVTWNTAEVAMKETLVFVWRVTFVAVFLKDDELDTELGKYNEVTWGAKLETVTESRAVLAELVCLIVVVAAGFLKTNADPFALAVMHHSRPWGISGRVRFAVPKPWLLLLLLLLLLL